MPPVWTALDVDGTPHYADLPLALAHLDDAVRAAAPAELAALDGRSPFDQAGRARAVAASLGHAFRAMNINPWRAPAWRGAWRSEYAPAGSTAVPAMALAEHTYGPNVGARSTGWIAYRAFGIYAGVTGGEPREQNVVLERLSLDPMGAAVLLCALFDGADPVCAPFAPGVLFVGHAAPAGAACSDPNDWRCGAWNDAPGAPLRLAPPLRWSVEAFGQIAAALRANPAAAVAAAVREARAAGASAAMGPATGAPPHAVADNPRVVRPTFTLPVVIRPPAPVGGPGGGTVLAPGAADAPVLGATPSATNCAAMPRLGTDACRDFFARDLARAEPVLRAAAARAVFGDAARGAELGPLAWEELWELAQLAPPERAAARWRELAWGRCALPPGGFASAADRTAWLAANPWCDPARVPAAPGGGGGATGGTPQGLETGGASGASLALALLLGAAAVGGGAWLLLRMRRPAAGAAARGSAAGRRRCGRRAAAAAA